MKNEQGKYYYCFSYSATKILTFVKLLVINFYVVLKYNVYWLNNYKLEIKDNNGKGNNKEYIRSC